jgi:hypothetical protein
MISINGIGKIIGKSFTIGEYHYICTKWVPTGKDGTDTTFNFEERTLVNDSYNGNIKIEMKFDGDIHLCCRHDDYYGVAIRKLKLSDVDKLDKFLNKIKEIITEYNNDIN